MNILDTHDLLMWGIIIASVLLATLAGMWLNRLMTYRAHRRALAAMRAEDNAQCTMHNA